MYILMDEDKAMRLTGMYSGSLFAPVKVVSGYACNIDNLTNPAFAAIRGELETCEVVSKIVFEVSDEI